MTMNIQRSKKFLAAAVLLIILLAGCAEAPKTISRPDPSNALERVAAVSYKSAIAPFRSQRPVQPARWRQQNEQVAPAPKPPQ